MQLWRWVMIIGGLLLGGWGFQSIGGAKAALDKDMQASAQVDSIALGAGCFWGAEKRYAAIPGVINAVSGYADGKGIKPSYSEITQDRYRMDPNNYAEVVKVTFDPSKVSLRDILIRFFESHDPTQGYRQGNDIGTQYRSVILTQNDSQAALARELKALYQTELTKAGFGAITTEIKPLTEFFDAEDYHQDYLAKNPNGYCPDHSTGVKFLESAKPLAVDNSALLQGKHIVVIEAEGYCPYCEKFRKDVTDGYRGTVPLHHRTATQLQGLTIKTPTFATPTLLFIANGKEVFGHQGYVSSAEFYKALGAFSLGDSEAFNVAFLQGTDDRFCKQYDLFKHTGDGFFVDKLSGEALFDTQFRFNSGTGWLSFTEPVPGATTEHADHSYGMDRIEVRAKRSGIHLGHVFPDGPNGKLRYCINATVLDFVPRPQYHPVPLHATK